MYISKIRIKNFKCIKDLTIKFEPHFNLIIGKNNSGKSTIFEAMRLWQLAFNRFLKDRTNNKESSFRSTQYYSFTINDLVFLRIDSFKRLFHTTAKSKTILIQITLNEKDNSIDLPIEFTLTTEELNLRFSLLNVKTAKKTDEINRDKEIVAENRKQASEKISKMIGKPQGSPLKNLVLITYINPIFQLPTNEPFYSKGYIREMLHQSKVANVLRNLIHPYAPKDYQTKAKQIEDKHLVNIEKQLDNILSGEIKTPEWSFTSDFKESEDANITIFANNNVNNSKVELSQLGSGTINLLNILSVLAFGDSEGINLNILLLDEPDSHLHSNHQIQLFKYLKEVSLENNKQMFIITHNHELISCAEKVIYVAGEKQVIQAIPQNEYCKILEEMAPNSDYYKMMVDNNRLQQITKPTLFCEGTTDVNILTTAFRKLYNKEIIGLDIVAGNSANGVAAKIINANKEIFTFGLFDSDKEGLNQYNGFNKNGFSKKIINENMQRLKYKSNNNSQSIETNLFVMKLPIPSFRTDLADWFCDNTCIEYMFSDDVLQKAGVSLEQKKGNNYKTIKDLDNEKTTIQKKINDFEAIDFEPFRPIFESINNYVTIF